MPERWHTFAREEVFPSYWPNALQAMLARYAENVNITLATATSVTVGVHEGGAVLAALSIQGNVRYRESGVTVSHPGGAAGTYDVYATAAEDDIDPTPLPFTDNTNYAFGATIVAGGATPTIVPGTVDVFRKVGEVVWDGSKITRIRQLVAHRTLTNGFEAVQPFADQPASTIRARAGAAATERALRVESSVGSEMAYISAGGRFVGAGLDAKGTTDLPLLVEANNAVDALWVRRPGDSQPRLSVEATGGEIKWGSGAAGWDTNLYRPAANQLKTDDTFIVGGDLQVLGSISGSVASSSPGNLVARSGVAAQTTIGNVGPASQAGILLGDLGDASLYRSNADELATGDLLRIFRGNGSDALSIKNVIGDANSKFVIQPTALGATLSWGPGVGSAVDVNLYRSAANVLKTDDAFEATGQVRSTDGSAFSILEPDGALSILAAAARTNLLFLRNVGEAFERLIVSDAGALSWGPGTGAADTNLYRAAANELKTDDAFTAVGAVWGNSVGATGRAFRVGNDAEIWDVDDANNMNVRGVTDGTTGEISFGSGNDVNIYRWAANILGTDDSLRVAGEANILGALNHDGSQVGFYGVAPVARSAAYSPTNVTTDRSFNADSLTVNELADVVGTLINDLKLTGIIG
jgi:hypothetical protein